MYSRTEDLLKIRDGEPIDARLHARLLADGRALAELERLRGAAAALRELPELDPPEDAWARIRSAAEHAAGRRRRRSRLAVGSAAGLAVVLLGVAAQLALQWRPAGPELARGGGAGGEPAYGALLEESARLESLLVQLPSRRHVMNAATAGTIAELEDRVALIDRRLSVAAANGLEPQYRQALWRERVDVMNALVQVRYAQAQAWGY